MHTTIGSCTITRRELFIVFLSMYKRVIKEQGKENYCFRLLRYSLIIYKTSGHCKQKNIDGKINNLMRFELQE